MKRTVLSLLGVLMLITMPLSPVVLVAVAEGEYGQTANNQTASEQNAAEYHAGNQTDTETPAETDSPDTGNGRGRPGRPRGNRSRGTGEQSDTQTQTDNGSDTVALTDGTDSDEPGDDGPVRTNRGRKTSMLALLSRSLPPDDESVPDDTECVLCGASNDQTVGGNETNTVANDNMTVVVTQASGWPTTSWERLSTDVDGCPSGGEHRDVIALYYVYDDQYLYLRMETVSPPGWPSTAPQGKARYKWWFDTAGTPAHLVGAGTSVSDAEFLLILEDRTDTTNIDGSRDQLGELTLMDDLANIDFAKRWNSGNSGAYIAGTPDNGGPSSLWERELGIGAPGVGGPQEVTGSHIGYRIDTTGGYFVDMYVSWTALGGNGPFSVCLIWATDIQNNNLDQTPNCDRPTATTCIPICIPPDCTITAPTSVCEDSTGNAASTTAGYTSYNWSLSAGTITTGHGTDSITWTAPDSSSSPVIITVTVTNGGCSNTCTKNVTVNALPTCNITASPATEVCAGVDVTLTEDGGDAVAWLWSTNQTTQSIVVSASDTYGVTITDASGCESYCEIEITVYEEPTCNVSAVPGTAVCAGVDVTLTEDGGDAVAWLWSTNQTTQSIVVSASDTYGVTITDASGCESYCEIEITVYEEPTCNVSAVPGTAVCAGVDVTLTEDGGDAVAWLWSTNQTTQSIVVSASDTYGVTITDASGCESYCEIEITVYEEPTCNVSAVPGTAVCAGVDVTLTEDGGDAVAWLWSTNQTTQSIVVSASDTYGVTITDASGCESYCEIEITVYEEPTCNVSAVPGTAVCAGVDVTLTEDGGDAVAWLWSTNQTTQSIVVSASDTYGVTITDASGCESYCEIEITVYEEPTCNVSAVPGTAVCAGVDVTLTEDGGDAVAWLWSTNQTTQSIVVSASDTYGVTITDASGCESYCEIEITVYEEPTCNVSAVPGTAVCAGVDVTLTEDGGDAVAWLWSTNQTTQSIVVSASDTYGVTITDASGCESYCEIEITVYEEPTCNVSAVPGTAVCAGVDVTLTEDGGDAVAWLWSTNQTTQSIVVSASDTYGVTITDASGCESYCEIEITVYEEPTCNVSAVPGTAVCAGVDVTLTEDGGDAVAWLWSTNQTTQSIVVSASDTYGVTITDANGCESYCEIEITVYETPVASASSNSPVPQGATIELYGGPDGMATYSWTGPDGFTIDLPNPTRLNATTAMAGTYTLTVTNEHGCTDDATISVVVTVPTIPTTFSGGSGCRFGCLQQLTVDWDENISTQCLVGDDRLGDDLFCPSADGMHSLLLEQGTQAPEVEGQRHYLIVIREIEETPLLPQNTVFVVAFEITPAGATFDSDIFLTLGFDELPGDAEEATIAYYDDIAGVWVALDSQPAEPNGVAELNLSAAVNHFTIFAVLVGFTPVARFVASDLSIEPSVERIWDPVTFVTRTGENVDITAIITNSGGSAGPYTVALKLNGQTIDSRTLTLAAGESQPVTFALSDMDYGQYEVEVADLSGTFTTSRTINWPPLIIVIVAIGLISWAVAWAIKRRKAARQDQREITEAQARLSPSNPFPIYYMFL